MIHRLKQVHYGQGQREVSCYHNSTEIITVEIYRLQCIECNRYIGKEYDGRAGTEWVRNQEIDHNLKQLWERV